MMNFLPDLHEGHAPITLQHLFRDAIEAFDDWSPADFATRIYNDAFGRDPEFFDLYRSLQAMETGLSGETTTYVGPPSGDFFRYFGEQPGTGQSATGQ